MVRGILSREPACQINVCLGSAEGGQDRPKEAIGGLPPNSAASVDLAQVSDKNVCVMNLEGASEHFIECVHGCACTGSGTEKLAIEGRNTATCSEGNGIEKGRKRILRAQS